MTGQHDTVVVWGNCQAGPLATLLREPLGRHGLQVELVPPVFLVDAEDLVRVQSLVSNSALLIGQPVRDDYRIPGCGLAQLAEFLPGGGRLLTFPVTLHVGAFPYQVNAHGADGGRVDAPLTDYHDLRSIVAAERGLDLAAAEAWWPTPDAAAVQAISAASIAELQRRETTLDVRTSVLIDGPHALWTMTHPTNDVLGALARSVLDRLGIAEAVDVPEREFLGARRAPVEAAVVRAHHWPATAASDVWRIDGRDVPAAETLQAHLDLYADRPDVVIDARTRYAERLHTLGLAA